MNNHLIRISARLSSAFLATASIVTLPATPTFGAPLPPGRSIAIESGPSGLTLSLPGIAAANYDIQVKSNLTTASWQPLATVTGVLGRTDYPLPLSDSPSRFFRVLFPQPAIEAGEPAFAPASGGAVYITGLFFYEGDTVLVGGVPLADVTFLSHTLLQATLPALPPGLYSVQVVSGHSGGVLATLPAAIEVAPPLDRTLQEPPEWPPAGPSPSYKKDFRGHVTLLKAFDDEPPAAQAKHTKTGHVTLMKAYDDEDPVAGRKHTKSGHVSLLKAFDDEEPPAAARPHRKTGHVTLLKAFDDGEPPAAARGKDFKGHVTLMKAFDDEDPAAGLRGIDKKDIKRRGVTEQTPLVRLHSGEVQQQVTDLAVAGRGLDFVWMRTYRSRTGQDTAQGARWSHSYDVRCSTNGTAIDVADGTGRRDTYRLQADGTYACPGLFREGAFTGGVFRLSFADTGFWEFLPLGAAPASGRLARIQDRSGNAITCGYDGAGRLLHVVDTLGRTNTVSYTSGGRVSSVTDCAGRTVSYDYYAGEPGGGAGDLKSVTSPPVTGTPNGNDFPDGKTVTYTYTAGQPDDRANHLLHTVTDAKGQVASTCTYDLDAGSASFQRVLAIQCGAEPAACVTYLPQNPTPDNRFAAMRCIVNDPVGNVTESFFDLRNRCVTQREYTGRAAAGLPVTESENRPAGKLRAGDQDLYETQVRWNNDSLCTRVTLPGGLAGLFVHGGDANTSARMRKRPELLYQAWDATAAGGADTDGDGAADLFKIEQRYTYDPRFGSDPMISNLRTRIDELEARLRAFGLLARFDGDNTPIIRGSALGSLNGSPAARGKGWLGKVKGTLFQGGDDDCDGFATTVTDPRDTVTTFGYDETGNRITYACSGPRVGIGVDAPTASFAYNAFGQCTAITNAPDASGHRRVDTIQWSTHPVVAIRDAGGNMCTTTFQRDNRGNVTNLVDPNGHNTLYTYNALDQLVTCSSPPVGDGAGQRATTTLFYDANDNVTRVDADNRRDTGDLVIANPAWTTRFAYDALDRCTAVETEIGAGTSITNRFEYDANGRLTACLAPPAVSGVEPHNRVAYDYDERGLPFRRTEAPGSSLAATAEWSYTSDGWPATMTVAGQTDATFAYDGFGRVSSVSDSRGNNENWHFDGAGDLTLRRVFGETDDLPGSASNRLLSESRWTYDGLGRRTRQVDSFFDVFTALPIDDGERTTRYAYAPNGQLAGVTNDLGHGRAYAYDTAGRLSAVTEPRAVRVSVRDAAGNITRITSAETSELGGPPQSFVTDCAYDACDRLVAVWDNVGNTNRWAYDSRDCVSRITDPRGNETRYHYDGRPRRTAAICYVGPCDADSSGSDRGITISTTHVEYDTAGRVFAVTDANTNTTTYGYDARDRLTQVSHPDGTARHLVWSPRSNLSVETNASGTVITYSYDPLGRLIRKDIACGAGVEQTTTFEAFAYDGLSRLVSASNDVSQAAFTYDSLGNTVSATQDGLTTSYVCDALGNRRRCTCPAGYHLHRTFGPNNQVSSVSVETNGVSVDVAGFSYEGPGRVARITRPNGVTTHVLWNGLVSPPNPADDHGWKSVAAVSHVGAAAGVIDERVFRYDRAQNKTSRVLTEPLALAGGTITNLWEYDALGRIGKSSRKLLSMLDYQVHTRVHDGKGNRIAVTNDGAAEVYTRDATLPSPGDFQMDQVTAVDATSYAYDDAGNRISRVAAAQPSFYHFDYAGRLVQVDALGGGGLVEPLAAFGYDALGRRVSKTVFPSGQPPDVIQYVYGDDVDEDCDGDADDDEIVETRKNGAVSSVSVLACGAGGGAAAASYAATGRLLAPPVAFLNAAGELIFTHSDDLGTVLALTDASGAVLERYDYGDFGDPAFLAADGTPLTDLMGLPAAASPAGNPFLFRGLQWDGETGLYIEGSPKTPARYMDPAVGQYLSRDSKLFCWGKNDRVFADNSPWVLKKEEGGRHTPFHNKRGWASITSPGIYINTKTTAVARNVLKSYFETGDIPTQDQFGALIDSFVSRGFGKSHELKGHVTLIK